MSKAYDVIVEALVKGVPDEFSWLSGAQEANLRVADYDEVFFSGEGVIDLYHAAELAITALLEAGYKVVEPENVGSNE